MIKKLTITSIRLEGFFNQETKNFYDKFVAWGWFAREDGTKGKAAIPDANGNWKFDSKEQAAQAVMRCRESFKKPNNVINPTSK